MGRRSGALSNEATAFASGAAEAVLRVGLVGREYGACISIRSLNTNNDIWFAILKQGIEVD